MHSDQLARAAALDHIDEPTSDELIGTFRNFRTLVISDVHLGSRSSLAENLVKFLNNCTAENIIINGDFIDFMAGFSLFDQKFVDVIQKLLKHARKGTKIWVLPGNHDAALRRFLTVLSDISEAEADRHLRFAEAAERTATRKTYTVNAPIPIFEELRHIGNILVLPELIYRTANNKRIHFSHGHEYDRLAFLGSWMINIFGEKKCAWVVNALDRMGTRSKELLFLGSGYINKVLGNRLSPSEYARNYKIYRDLLLPRFSMDFLAAFNAKTQDRRTSDPDWAKEPAMDGKGVGHNHEPSIIKVVTPEGDERFYFNSGDWVKKQHCTALAETADGQWRLWKWYEPHEAESKIGIESFEQSQAVFPNRLLPQNASYVSVAQL